MDVSAAKAFLSTKPARLAGGAFLLVLLLALTPGFAAGRLESFLAGYGFNSVSLKDIAMGPTSLVARDILLDPDGFSTVDLLRAEGNPLGLVTGRPDRLLLDGVQLTGEWYGGLLLDLAGWSGTGVTMPLSLPAIPHIILTQGKADLETPAGLVRIEAQGDLERSADQDGVSTFEGSVWGTQHQLKIDSFWRGFVTATGGFEAEGDIREARLNLDALSASRMSGWLSLARAETAAPLTLGGQIIMGRLAAGDLVLSDTTLTLDGPLESLHMIVGGKISSFEDATLAADLRNSPQGLIISASLETARFDDLSALLTKIREQTENAPGGLRDAFMPLLITEGNMTRVKRDLPKENYHRFVLQIEGPLSDLNGKIVAMWVKDGVAQNNIVSLNPAVAAGNP